MRQALRLAALLFIFVTASMAWMVLGATTAARSSDATYSLRSKVASLWGESLDLRAPAAQAAWQALESRTETWTDDEGVERSRVVQVPVTRTETAAPSGTEIEMTIDEDIRRKGLVWFPLYDVDFAGRWVFTYGRPEAGELRVTWDFPASDGFYDDFAVLVDGVELADTSIVSNTVQFAVPAQPGQVFDVAVRFRSRGNEQLVYHPAHGVSELEAFSLVLHTDFDDIDFPSGTLSPTDRTEEDGGWRIAWTFDRMLSGKGMGVIVPSPVQPGELVASMAFSAPISLGLFMVWIYVLGMLRGIDVHPVNHAFLAAAFFAFHLLFAYSADLMPVEWAFAMSAAVSLMLVLTYLARVVSPRFATLEAGLAQLVYLVGFALAHFWDGATGLTLTVIGIGTLFALMQLTSHVRWSDVFAGKPVAVPAK